MIRQYLLPLGLGALGVVLALCAVHLYVDHVNLHALINMVQHQAAQAADAAKVPGK